MPKSVSRLMLWVGWIFPFVLILLLMPLWKSVWALFPIVGEDLLYLALVFFAVAAAAIVAHVFTSKKSPNWRFNFYLVFIFALSAAILLILDFYYSWNTVLWF